MMTWRSSTI